MTVWHKQVRSMINRSDLIIVVFSLIMIFVNVPKDNLFYVRFGLCVPIFRVFTLIKYNRDLVLTVNRVIADFSAILMLLVLFIIIWARIGVTAFEGVDRKVLDSYFEQTAETDT
eukprot:UN05894